MKVGILAGGAGTRLAEETELKPKPMVEIETANFMAIIKYIPLWVKDFVIALGFKGEVIKNILLITASFRRSCVNLKSGNT